MKVFTNENNTATLKLLISAKLGSKSVELVKATLTDKIFSGPHSLPLLVINDELWLFSSNAGSQYLFPLENADSGLCNQYLEFESTRLYPAVQSVVAAKTVAADLKQVLAGLLKDLDIALSNKKWLVGDKISVADISIWSTLYPLYYNNDVKAQYLSGSGNLSKWIEIIACLDGVKEAVIQWGGSPNPPFGSTSSLGLPQLSSLASAGSPDQAGEVEISVTPEEREFAKENYINGASRLQPLLKQEKVVVPLPDRKNILVTSALPYVNNVPHLGNIIGCVLSADIFARYCRLCDYNAIYICGTDEYGTATETKALEEGVTPRQICDKYFALHSEVYNWFNIRFDHFGRTSTKEQTEITQQMFLKLNDNGFINKQTVDQLFCTKCDRFLADRFVEGTCHHPGCLYPDARGDQCDKCGKLINATELIQPRCKVCSSSPTIKGSVQLFLELGALEPAVRSWASKVESNWSPPARAVTKAWLRDGLKPRAVTRDLKWGVPVPLEEYKNKVFYVWFDAPMGYLSITQCATKQYQKWWKPTPDRPVKLYQFMAKDNVPFHAVMFPATLIGVNEGHLLVDRLYATEYLNYEEGKFSKSRGVGVFGSDVKDTGIEADVWRYYLASIRPETSDSSFSWIELGTRNNSELLNNLGNFCHRSLSFCERTFSGRVPSVKLEQTDCELIALVNRDIQAYVKNMERGRLREALRNVMSISRLGNQHMQATQPWVLLKGSDDDKERGATAIGICCQVVALLCTLMSPYTPEVCRKLANQLNIDTTVMRINPESPSFHEYLPSGHVIGKPEPLFSKIETDTLEALRKKYAGTQSDRAGKENGPASLSNVAELEDAIAKQGEVVRKLKASTKDKSVWQPEVDKLLSLKKRLTETQKVTITNAGDSGQLEREIAEQGEKVRKLKASTKDKSVWQPEVDKLLSLKKRLTEVQLATKVTATNTNTEDSGHLEKAIAEQGEKVRKLKASTKDKSVWQPEVDKLLSLKKRLTEVQLPNTKSNTSSDDERQKLEAAIAEQGDKVRKLKASTKDKAVWQPEVNLLLDLKKKLAALQV